MNWQHLQAFVWLRWRLMANTWRRAGSVNAVLMSVLTIVVLATAIPLFLGTFLLGLYAIPKAAPAHLMYAWDAVILAFLFFWSIGLVTELQRTEPLSMAKFLHLPVSVNGAFLINYLGSLVRLSLILFVPAMLGYSLALVVVRGVRLFPVLPLLAAFLLMITALTYQFQGWLASLMSNPRRRRTIVVTTTAVFVLIFQLPNLLNAFTPWAPQRRAELSTTLTVEMEKLNRAALTQQIDAQEHVRLQQELMQKYQQDLQQANRESAARWERAARLVNLVLPVGWLPFGVMSAAEGKVVPALLGVVGLATIGTVSLWRAYRTTIRQYQGELTYQASPTAPAALAPARVRKPGKLLVEARIPGLSEPVSAIALGGFRALVRSPEAKMMLMTPLIMIPIFGTMLFKGIPSLPVLVRPLTAIAGMLMVLFGLLQLMCNQFGFDRDGFRVFVLSAASRRDILLGKNLAVAPLAMAMAAIVLPIVELVSPLRLDLLVAMIPQGISMFLLLCMLTNLLSIYTPIYVAAGAIKPANPKLSTVLVQMAMFTFLFPLTQGLTLLPLGIEALLSYRGWGGGFPVCLLLALLECAAILVLYRVTLDWQGRLLQARERKILDIVTSRAL